jgi:flagellar basal body P-ring protein FlgI
MRERTGLKAGSVLVLAACVGTALSVAACNNQPRRQARDVEPVIRDAPAVLRGTIGTEATLFGVEPVLVSGFGLVVGLNGTGGGVLPVQVQATMERELARGGIGRGGPVSEGPLAGKTPREMLRDPSVAVVVVEGVVPPGAPMGARFDVRVRTLAGSGVTSLEGGKLWTTVLNLGPASAFGARRTQVFGEARGSIFINPFADPGGGAPVTLAPPERIDPPAQEETANAAGAGPRSESGGEPPAGMADAAPAVPMSPLPAAMMSDGVSRTVGRVLNGGEVTQPLRMILRLDNPSHARAMSMVQAINSRFPPGPGQPGQTARGRDASLIEITVPPAFADRSADFVQLLRFTQIDQSFPQEYAKRYADALRSQPALAVELGWALEALGRPAIPFVQPLYDDPELLPRLTALRVGARLGDPRVAPGLIEMARSGPVAARSEAITLLTDLPPDGSINLALRELASATELEIRVAAYEALRLRGDPAVDRNRIAGFWVDIVQSSDDLIYVKQSGEPRIVIFGNRPRLNSPAIGSAWNDRLLVKVGDVQGGLSTASPDLVQLYYRDYRTEKATLARLDRDVLSFIRFLAQRPTPDNPDPGLGLSYSEIVGVLYQVQRSGALPGVFATENDRLLARLLEAQDLSLVSERPENEDLREDELEARMKPLPREAPAPVPAATPRSLVVPLSGPQPVQPRKGD